MGAVSKVAVPFTFFVCMCPLLPTPPSLCNLISSADVGASRVQTTPAVGLVVLVPVPVIGGVLVSL